MSYGNQLIQFHILQYFKRSQNSKKFKFCFHIIRNTILNDFEQLKVQTLSAPITVHQVFSTSIHFQLCSQEYQSHEKCIRVNFIQSCKSGRCRLSFRFCEKFIGVDLILFLRIEFAAKVRCINNQIYGISDTKNWFFYYIKYLVFFSEGERD